MYIEVLVAFATQVSSFDTYRRRRSMSNGSTFLSVLFLSPSEIDEQRLYLLVCLSLFFFSFHLFVSRTTKSVTGKQDAFTMLRSYIVYWGAQKEAGGL